MIHVTVTLLLGNREIWQAMWIPTNDSGYDLASWLEAFRCFQKVENAQWEQNRDKSDWNI